MARTVIVRRLPSGSRLNQDAEERASGIVGADARLVDVQPETQRDRHDDGRGAPEHGESMGELEPAQARAPTQVLPAPAGPFEGGLEDPVGQPPGSRLLEPPADRFVEPSVAGHHAVLFWATAAGGRASASSAARSASVA